MLIAPKFQVSFLSRTQWFRHLLRFFNSWIYVHTPFEGENDPVNEAEYNPFTLLGVSQGQGKCCVTTQKTAAVWTNQSILKSVVPKNWKLEEKRITKWLMFSFYLYCHMYVSTIHIALFLFHSIWGLPWKRSHLTIRAVFNWLSTNQNRSNHNDQLWQRYRNH